MNDKIKELFPKDFYINKGGEMVAEISLSNLNKIADYIIFLIKKKNKLEKNDEEKTLKRVSLIKNVDLDKMLKEHGKHYTFTMYVNGFFNMTQKQIDYAMNYKGKP